MKTPLNEIETHSPELGADALLYEYRKGNIVDLAVEGVERDDYPDFCNAYLTEGTLLLGDGHWRALTEGELNILTDTLGEVVNTMSHASFH